MDTSQGSDVATGVLFKPLQESSVPGCWSLEPRGDQAIDIPRTRTGISSFRARRLNLAVPNSIPGTRSVAWQPTIAAHERLLSPEPQTTANRPQTRR